MRIFPFIVTVMALLPSSVGAEQRLPIFDCHMHYSANSWDEHSPSEIVARMDRAGVPRAVVSSSPDDGTLKLLGYAPARFVPELRPYRGNVHSGNWAGDGSTPAYLSKRLGQRDYVGIGEFHLHDPADATTATMKAVIALAAESDIYLHVHSGAEAVRRIFSHNPEIRILWAHAGMTEPARVVGEMLDSYANLTAELSFRAGDINAAGAIDPEWRDLLSRHKDRFVIGSDTYVASRFADYEDIVEEHRGWLKQLPTPVAFAIAYGNAGRICANESR